MKKSFLLLFSIIIIYLLVACTNTSGNQLSKSEKISDFQYLYKVIEEGYPFLEVNKRLNNIDWLSKKSDYLKRITNTKNDEQFIRSLSSIIYELNNKHTHLIKDKPSYDYFKNVYSTSNYFGFFDEKVVVNRYEKLDFTSSNEIQSNNYSSVDKLILQDVINNEVGYMYIPEMLKDKEYLTAIENYIDTLEDYKTLVIDIRGNRGGSDACWNTIVSKLAKNDLTSTGYMLFRYNSPTIRNYLNRRELSLESISKLPNKARENMPSETFDMFSGFYKINKTIPKNNNYKFDGNIYLLVDNSVYSSSESFSIFCKDTGFATLIGETTGGDGGGIDPILFYLKNSGLIVRMSSDMYITSNGTCNEEFKTIPDYEIQDCTRTSNFADDNCIKKVLELEKSQ
ncbi:peptidase S41 [Romboutsia ilealis]|uniref:Peptidase S41 n=1 Tax=Romboutsia faecis TaxID=2764597 RepID=A0ABR7JKD0_9FIRM|nr:S41 family peptidase [Romboutsia faecis]MBC5995379.1 peptidase S41 [Romboutsia faecis]MRN24379.1 peptidase S41 [Romboutsia ilealis]